jgi:hypothetical protein
MNFLAAEKRVASSVVAALSAPLPLFGTAQEANILAANTLPLKKRKFRLLCMACISPATSCGRCRNL